MCRIAARIKSPNTCCNNDHRCGVNLYQNWIFKLWGCRRPCTHLRGPIEVQFCTAKRTYVPLGRAKFHMNRRNESFLRGENADCEPLSKNTGAGLPWSGKLPLLFLLLKSLILLWWNVAWRGDQLCNFIFDRLNYFGVTVSCLPVYYFSLLVNCDTLRFVVMSFSLSTELDVFSLLDITLWCRCAGGWRSYYDKEVKVLALWSS